MGTAVAGCDWICRELATYDFGGLTDYLHTEVPAALTQRAQHIDRWAETPLCGYVYEDVALDQLTIRDVGTGERREVLHIGALAGTTTSAAHVIARSCRSGAHPGGCSPPGR